MITEAFDYKFKMVIIGNSQVGKSCIILRYTDGSFNDNHLATVGVDFHIKDLIYNNKKIKLQLWDTAGQERFRAISNSYCRGSDGVIFAYDMTKTKSFEDISTWIDSFISKDNEMIKVLICTKSDLEHDRKITKEQGKELAQKYKMDFFETSSKTNHNINEVFDWLIGEMYKREMSFEIPREPKGSFHLKNQSKKKKCCK